MAITNMQIMTWIGINVVNQRNAIISNLLSDGLGGLEHMTHDDVKDTCSSYAKRTDSPFPIMFAPLAKQRIYSLALWVQDTIRAEQTPTFPDCTNRNSFIQLLNYALVGDRNRKSQKKVGGHVIMQSLILNSNLKDATRSSKKNCSLHCQTS